MDFGNNWLQPIQKRLSDKYSFLNSEQLNKYDEICKIVMNSGHNFIYQILEKLDQNKQTISEADLKEKLKCFILENNSWVNKENLKKIYSQSCYYAYKDGLDKAIK